MLSRPHKNAITCQYLINQPLMAFLGLFTFFQVTKAIFSLSTVGISNENKGWKSIALVLPGGPLRETS